MKEGVRMLALACGPLKKKRTLLVGIVSKLDIIEGIVSTYIDVDGSDSTERITRLIKRSRFRDQIKVVAINGVGMAGLNILDVEALSKATSTKLVSVTRQKPHPPELIKALRSYSKMEKKDVRNKIALVGKLKDLNEFKLHDFYLQTNMEKGDANKFVLRAVKMVRLAHLIASGVTEGESKGRM